MGTRTAPRLLVVLALLLTAGMAHGESTPATPISTPVTPQPTPTGYGCDGPNAPAPAGVRGLGGVTEEQLEAAVQAATTLRLGRIVARDRHNAPFALGQDLVKGTGKPADQLPVVVADCALRVGLPMVREGKLVGRLRVGLCDRTSELTDAQLCTAKQLLAAAVPFVGVTADTRMAGLPPQVEQRDGLTIDYFPVLLRGRGLVLFYTAIATAPGSRYAVVVQVDGEKPCADTPPAAGCTGLAEELTRVATTLGTRFLLGK
ncbi:MAG: hypothetical protein SF182_05475 [Deltaproteobacteria bacterium]|nr:hypothetical protein [Deltaproteobacteria bacterium]